VSKHIVAALAIVLIAAAGWTLAQQPGSGRGAPIYRGTAPEPPAAGTPGAPGTPVARAVPGRYTVALSGERGLLVDTITGKSWDLQRGVRGRAVWVPAERLDSDKDVQRWLDEEQSRGAKRRQATEEERREREAREAALRDQVEKLREEAQIQRARAQQALQEAEQRLRELQRKQAPQK